MSKVRPWDYDWPKARQPTQGEDPGPAMTAMMTEHRTAWRQHRPVIHFLEDHWPRVWESSEFTGRDGAQHGEGVRWCRTEPAPVSSRQEDDLEVVELKGCGRTPYCPACNDAAARKRGYALLRKFEQATPKGEDTTLQLITLAVSEKPEKPSGVTGPATKNWRGLRSAAYRTIEWMYGEGVGAFVVYQEYGQRLFGKQRPHVHALVHHWLPVNGEAQRVPIYALKNGGQEALRKRWFEELRAELPMLNPESHEDWVAGRDVDVKYLDHPGKIAKSTKYVVREVIDFRELRYNRFRQDLTVFPYKDDGELGPTIVPMKEMKAAFLDYSIRCGSWGHRGRPSVMAAYGAISDKKYPETLAAIGRGREHFEGCWCSECSTWVKRWEDATRPMPINAAAPRRSEEGEPPA